MRAARAAREHGPAFAYRPALDGVRALAVTAVLLFHGGVAVLPGGFLGVDAFFVLSGVLITSLLLAEHEQTGRIRLGAFWGRRARRLLPALLVVLAVAAFALYRPDDVNRAYFGTDPRAQALLIGCALATVPLTKGRRILGALAVLGTLGTAWLWTHADGTDGWLYRGGLTAAALAVAAV